MRLSTIITSIHNYINKAMLSDFHKCQINLQGQHQSYNSYLYSPTFTEVILHIFARLLMNKATLKINKKSN